MKGQPAKDDLSGKPAGRPLVMLRKIGLGLAAALFIVSVLPYLIPVTRASNLQLYPFANSSHISLHGVSLHYRTWYEGGGMPPAGKILLVHGLGGSTFSWRGNIDALLAAGYYVLAVDLPGFGYSERRRPVDHSQEGRSLLLWGLLGEIDAKLAASYGSESAVAKGGWFLVGHSLGAGTVTAMALADPDRTNALIYVAPAVLSGGKRSLFIWKYPPFSRWVEVLGRHLLLNEKRVSAFLFSAYGRPPLPEEVEGYLDPLQLAGTEGAFVDLVRTSTSITPAALEQLKVPVGAIWGELDAWVPVADADRLREIIPHLELRVIPGSYHCPMETDRELFNAYLLELLALAAAKLHPHE